MFMRNPNYLLRHHCIGIHNIVRIYKPHTHTNPLSCGTFFLSCFNINSFFFIRRLLFTYFMHATICLVLLNCFDFFLMRQFFSSFPLIVCKINSHGIVMMCASICEKLKLKFSHARYDVEAFRSSVLSEQFVSKRLRSYMCVDRAFLIRYRFSPVKINILFFYILFSGFCSFLSFSSY